MLHLEERTQKKKERVYGDRVLVEDLGLKIGDSLSMLYDFGDSWTFALKLENIVTDSASEGVVVIKSSGKPPPQY